VSFSPAAPPREPVRFGDGLSGSWVTSKNGAAVVLAHGSGADRTQLEGDMRILARDGFGVLAFDWPGHGESAGEVRLGRNEVRALRDAVDFVARKDDVHNAHIGVLGASIGAAIAVVAAAEDPRVRAVVAAGAFTDAVAQTRFEYAAHGWFAQAGAVWVVRSRTDTGNFRPIDAAPALRGRRVLFVTCEDDRVVPAWMGEELARAAGGELWAREGCGHEEWSGKGRDAVAWEARLLAFFRDALGVPPP
jgi:pimeloyl-ACP methyl ester carboxylesterase